MSTKYSATKLSRFQAHVSETNITLIIYAYFPYQAKRKADEAFNQMLGHEWTGVMTITKTD